MSKITPPMALIPYIEFEDGKVVSTKPIPWYLKPAFKRYCKAIERKNSKKKMNYL